jgi:hypothetical protein
MERAYNACGGRRGETRREPLAAQAVIGAIIVLWIYEKLVARS